MGKKIEKIKENKFLNFLGNFLYTILLIFVVLVLIIVVLQRVSNNSLTLGGFRIFNVLTGSMVPEYQVGDIILTKEIDPNEINVGDDITYMGAEADFMGKIVTHRVKEVKPQDDGTKHFITKGIANDLPDPEISQEQIQGKVLYKFILLSFISKMVSNLYSMYFVVFIPIGIIIFINIRRIYLDLTGKDDDDEDNKK